MINEWKVKTLVIWKERQGSVWEANETIVLDVGGGYTVHLACDNKPSHVLRNYVIVGVHAKGNY